MAPFNYAYLRPVQNRRTPRRLRHVLGRSNLDRMHAARAAAAVITVAVLLAALFGLPVALLVVQRALWEAFDASAAVAKPLNPQVLLLSGVVGGWLFWVWLIVATVGDIVAALKHGPRRPHLLPSPLRAIVTALAGSLLTAATTASTAYAAPSSTSTTSFAAETKPLAAPLSNAVVALPTFASIAPATSQAEPVSVKTVTVRHGDCLWNISKQQLGDPHRWREIFVLNRGQPQANGYALTDPDEIHVGWVLALPALNPVTPAPGNGESTGPAPGPTNPAPPAPSTTTSPSTPASPSGPAPSAPSTPSSPATPAPTADATDTAEATTPSDNRQAGITLPSQGWISLGLAATIAAVAALLRLHRRRHARLGGPIPVSTGPTRPPVPADLALADAAGRRDLKPDTDPELTDEPRRPAIVPALPVVDAPIGVDAGGVELSLFDLPGPGLALNGPGAEPAARAILASALATGVSALPAARPVIVTTPSALARLLPHGADPSGLDPHGVTFDGERLLVLADTAAAVTHAEEEMIARRRLLDTVDSASIADLNDRNDHVEHQPPYVLLIDNDPRHAGRVTAIGAHRAALHLHPVILGDADTMTALTVADDGTLPDGGRFATLTATDLAQLLAMIAATAARPEPGNDLDDPTAPSDETRGAGHPDETGETPEARSAAVLAPVPDLPTGNGESPALVRLTVLGPVTVSTDAGPVTTGMRSGSYAALALLAAYPHGRTLRQIADDLHPDADPTAAVNRVRTDITTARRVLRTATGTPKAKFIIYDPATTRYRLDPDTIEVDLWRMLTAIGRANTATDDTTALAALREAADLYSGDFADGQDRAWVTDYATTHRHQILGVYSRIAELLEADQPDAAVAALETALRHDPVNEELYQRVIRIHGRQHRPDAVRRTLRRLETQLAELGEAEPSEATRRLAARQLHPAPVGARP